MVTSGVCRTVDYGPSVSPHSLSVHHAERLGGSGGPVRSRDGVAVMIDTSQPGKLRAVMEGKGQSHDLGHRRAARRRRNGFI